MPMEGGNMRTVTIILPDEFICCATTAVAHRTGAIATFTNCFNLSKDEQIVKIQRMNDDSGYELIEVEPPKEDKQE